MIEKHISMVSLRLGDEERRALLAVVDSGQLSQGEVVAELEARFAEWCDVRYAIALSSGTAALHVALLAYGVGPGDEVITTPFSFIASANAALFVGARPVFVDVDERTFCIAPESVEAAITPRTRAILPVHLYGHPAAMVELRAIARQHGLLLIEDACQAHGALIDGRPVGSLGDCGVFSFYSTKHIAAGEGGMITTNDSGIAERARLLRNHGASKRYFHEILGYNLRLSDLHAAVGLAQLGKVERAIEARRRNAAALTDCLGGLASLIPPCELRGHRHVYHQYTVRLPGGRGDLPRQLEARGIATSVHYPVPIHRQPVYASLGYGGCHLRIAERLADEVLSLPIHPDLAERDIAYMGRTLWHLLRQR
jgi:dTDP-4-amino-4,6-dideoxygalactose transaminase